MGYISAHTHKAYWAAHPVGDRVLTELSIGSLLDFPNEYRDFELRSQGDVIWARSAVNPSRARPYCPESWMPEVAEYTRYRSSGGFDPNGLQRHLWRDQARTWLRELEGFGLPNEEERSARGVLKNALLGTPSRGQPELKQAVQTAEQAAGDPVLRWERAEDPAERETKNL